MGLREEAGNFVAHISATCICVTYMPVTICAIDSVARFSYQRVACATGWICDVFVAFPPRMLTKLITS